MSMVIAGGIVANVADCPAPLPVTRRPWDKASILAKLNAGSRQEAQSLLTSMEVAAAHPNLTLYACGIQVAVVLCPNLLTTEGSFDSPTVVPQVPWLYARAYSVRIVSSAFKQESRVSKRRFVSTGWEPKTKTKSIHFIASSSEGQVYIDEQHQ
jgi:hypothetical protein